LDITCNMIVQGNVGIGTLIPLNPLHVEQDAIFMNGNVGIGTTIPSATLHVVGTVNAPLFTVNNIYTSNLTLTGDYIVLNAGQEQINQLQMEPVYTTFQITDTSRTDYTLVYNGLFTISPEKTDVYINGYKMAYKATNSKDYDVRYEFDVFNLKSYFTVILNSTVEYGDVVHIVFWPNYLQDSGVLRAGYLLQEIDLRRWNPFTGSNIHYLLGNVGIGTTQVNYTLEVQGSSFISTLSNETLSVTQRLSTSSLGIGTFNPSSSVSIQTTDGIHLPMGTNEQRPSVGEGVVRYNTSLNLYEGSFLISNGCQWKDFIVPIYKHLLLQAMIKTFVSIRVTLFKWWFLQ